MPNNLEHLFCLIYKEKTHSTAYEKFVLTKNFTKISADPYFLFKHTNSTPPSWPDTQP